MLENSPDPWVPCQLTKESKDYLDVLQDSRGDSSSVSGLVVNAGKLQR